MKYLDEYRDPPRCRSLVQEIARTVTRPRTIMEVCGGQTHGLLAHGIDKLLARSVRLIHGPGCPVCVTPAEAIDLAISLAERSDLTLASFGDMLRVPGSQESLLQARARGGDVRLVYSPLDAVQYALKHPQRQVVFFAIGFETTAPATALAVQQADRLGLENFSLLVSHVRVQPAMEAIMEEPDCQVEGFLAAGHVCTVGGYECYRRFVERYHVPVVVTGFEPVDLLTGILDCVTQIEQEKAAVSNCYQRSVREQGNIEAQRMIDDVYEVCDQAWRGLGTISGGGLRLRGLWRRYDAAERFGRAVCSVTEPSPCRSGEVLIGRIKPTECECFGRECTPQSPLGAPMISSEGACAAYYRYHRAAVADRPTVKPVPAQEATP